MLSFPLGISQWVMCVTVGDQLLGTVSWDQEGRLKA